MGGYSRHQIAFRKFHLSGLVESLQEDVNRLPTRNLGRDDRIISSHGREARYPFLDENVVNFLSSLPVTLKTDLRRDRGIGDKLILRLLARNLGLIKSSSEPKRAIQFGARSAKLSSQKEKGSDKIQMN